MSEAEDVLLDAAERVAAATRALWARGGGAARAADGGWASARRRVDYWLVACFGRSWPLVPIDRPGAPGWLARSVGSLPPWARSPKATAGTDGTSIHLPRECADVAAVDVRLLAALGLGMRLAEGTAGTMDSWSARRTLRWCVEAARAEQRLVRQLPGLRPRLTAARARALDERPALGRLHPVERALEGVVRALLERPLDGTDPSRWEPCDALASLSPEQLARCRGVAPVAHWGVPLSPSPSLEVPRPAGGGRPTRSRRLPRRPRRRAPDSQPGDPRPGPFLLAPSDPHLAVQDAAGLDRPHDQQQEESLDELADELGRQDELPVVCDERPVHEVLDTEPQSRGSASEPRSAQSADAVAWRYPEWDHRIGALRPGACILRESTLPSGDVAWAESVRRRRVGVLRLLRRRFAALRPRRVRLTRQSEGDDVDVDGWVDEFAQLASGREGSGRLYSREQPGRRDVAALLLLDSSGSTDAWVSGDRSVIDVAREAALCFADALSALGDRFAIQAFSGRGARDVRVHVAKGFDERAGPVVDARLAALAPDAFTRLGAPLRHATACLLGEPARRRLLLLFSDGKPDDEDLYEGEYGLEDVRQAVVEARAVGVRVFCITIDRAGATYLARLFGPSGYTVLHDVAQLPERLPEIYRHLTAR